MPRQFVLPDLGEGIAEAQVIKVMVKPGDRISQDQYLMEVETDKAAVEIPSPYEGIAKEIHVKEGQTINVGAVIVTFDDGSAGGAAPMPERGQRPKVPERSQPVPARQDDRTKPAVDDSSAGKTVAPAAPAVRKMARELGVDLDRISGSGPGGRVTREDVEHAAAGGGLAVAPRARSVDALPARSRAMPLTVEIPGTPDQDKWGKIYREPLSQIRKTIANQMKRSAYTAPHVTHCDEADITELERMRKGLNEATGNDPKLTVLSFVIRATCIALRRFPIFNSSFDEEAGQIIYKDYVNMGVAVDTERGLIVPVIRNADQLTMRGIAAALRSIAEHIRTNQFSIDDLRGGTFTITNVGALGGTFSTPIINYPEVAILGLGRSRKVPVFKDDELVEAMMLPLNLSFDHRATDGANAARFTREIISYLETPAKFLLD